MPGELHHCWGRQPFRLLAGNQQPDHSRVSDFRRSNLNALKGMFIPILRLCQKAGMVSLGHVALDGTKMQANASKHNAMSHERMLRAEKELEQEINALMRKAEILDAQEDRKYGKGKRGSELPEELRHKQSRLARIRQARKEMEAETAAATARQRHEEAQKARAKATAARDNAIETAEHAGREPPDLEQLAADAMPIRGLARKADGTPTTKTQRNFTDPESHLMQFGGTYLQAYNCQLAVDSDHQVIVAVGVSNQPPDVEHLEPMLERITVSAGALPDMMTMDAGYWSEDNAKACADQGINAYIATGRLPHGQPPPPRASMGAHFVSRRGVVINAVEYLSDRWAGALSATNSYRDVPEIRKERR